MSDSKKPKRGRQWHRSYEAQLTEKQRQALYAALLDRTLSDVELCQQLPPWRKGQWKGLRVQSYTLARIRTRLELAEELRAAEQTTETILKALREQSPDLTPDQLDEFGQRTFTALAIQQRDPKTFVALRRTRLLGKAQELNERRFRRETCELYLRWAANAAAERIRLSPASNHEKIEQLGRLMFGEEWEVVE